MTTTKLSFRSRQLDPSKPMPIFRAEDVPDLAECTAISRGVPVLPSGMEKEEEGVSIFSQCTQEAAAHARSFPRSLARCEKVVCEVSKKFANKL